MAATLDQLLGEVLTPQLVVAAHAGVRRWREASRTERPLDYLSCHHGHQKVCFSWTASLFWISSRSQRVGTRDCGSGHTQTNLMIVSSNGLPRDRIHGRGVMVEVIFTGSLTSSGVERASWNGIAASAPGTSVRVPIANNRHEPGSWYQTFQARSGCLASPPGFSGCLTFVDAR